MHKLGEGALKAGKSKQEILGELAGLGIVVKTQHGNLGGSEAMDFLFSEELEFDLGPRGTMRIKLGDLAETDWHKGASGKAGHGTGPASAKAGLTSWEGVRDFYNGSNGRINHYNRIIRTVKSYVDFRNTQQGDSPSDRGSDYSTDAWYRRRATQIASDIVRNQKARVGAGGAARGSPEDLLLEFQQGMALGDAWAAELIGGTEAVTLDDLAHVLHHMGNAGAIYEDAQDNIFHVDEYAQMMAFDESGEWSVIINFRINNNGEIEQLRDNDVGIFNQSISDIFIDIWKSNKSLTDHQILEARQLAETAAGMSDFNSYFAEEAGVASLIYGKGARFTARVDAAIPAYMDDMMWLFFTAGNAEMKKGIKELLSDVKRTGQEYSSSLRQTLKSELTSLWPTMAWGSGARGDGWSGDGNDLTHSSATMPPMGLARQFHHGIDFENFRSVGSTPRGVPKGQFYPQLDNETWMKAWQTDEEYEAEHGFLPSATSDEVKAVVGEKKDIPKRKRKDVELGVTDFEEAALNQLGPSSIPWWYILWNPGRPASQSFGQSDLGFVWAAPYVVWQHYRRSGSVSY